MKTRAVIASVILAVLIAWAVTSAWGDTDVSRAGWHPVLFEIIQELEDHIHAGQKCYPDLADGTTLTGGAGAWQLGAVVNLIPANTITREFDLHYCNVGSASAADTYQIKFYCSALFATLGDSMIACMRTSKAAGANTSSPSPLMTPQCPANARISAQVASSSGGGDQLVISVQYHTY